MTAVRWERKLRVGGAADFSPEYSASREIVSGPASTCADSSAALRIPFPRCALRLPAVALALVCAAAPAQDDPAPPAQPTLPVLVFYSKEDPTWPEAERVIGVSIARTQGRATVEKVSIDQPEGYARLAKIEKALGLENPGEITAVVGQFALVSKGKERREVENYLATVLARLLTPGEVKQRRNAATAEFARAVFADRKGGVELEREEEALGAVYHRVLRTGPEGGKELAGYVVEAYRTIQCPVCADAHFLVALTPPPETRVLKVQPVRKLEGRFGLALSAERETTFLRQFENRAPDSKFQLDAISGATKTSQAYDRALAAILAGMKKRTAKP